MRDTEGADRGPARHHPFTLAGLASGFDDPATGEGDWLASRIRQDPDG